MANWCFHELPRVSTLRHSRYWLTIHRFRSTLPLHAAAATLSQAILVFNCRFAVACAKQSRGRGMPGTWIRVRLIAHEVVTLIPAH
jgi:hypothetical protein